MAHFPHWRRLLRWMAFSLPLAGIGAALHVALPPVPRWSLAGTVRNLLTDDGAVLATYTQHGQTACGPVQFWDVATGGELERLLADEPAFLAHARSRDGRYFIAVLAGGKPDVQRIAWVDLHERKTWQVEAPLGEFSAARFTGTCHYLAVRRHKVGAAQASYTLAETATGRVIARFAVPCRAPTRKEDFWDHWPDSTDDGMFTEDGRFFAINHSGGAASAMRIVDLGTGKGTVVADARLRALVPDSRSLIAERDGTTWIWDLAAMDWRAPLEVEAPDTLRFSADGRWMASVPPNQKQPVPLRFFDLRTGRLHWELKSITCNSEEMQEERFAPDSRCFLLPTAPAVSQRRLTMYDVEAKRKRWERTVVMASYGDCLFTSDSRMLISALRSSVEVIDVATGQPRYTINMPQSVQIQPWLSRDERTLYLLPGPPDPSFWSDLLEDYWPWRHNDLETAVVPLHAYDLATGRELWRLETPYLDELVFADDYIVALHHHHEGQGPPISTTIACWDVPPRIRLGWVVGTPAGIGVGLIVGPAAWRRYRRRRAPA